MTRIEEMITQDESVWNFNNFSPPHPWKCIGKTKENLNFDIRVERVNPQEMPFLNNCHIIVINKLLNTFLFIPIFLHLGPKQIYIWEHYWNFVPNNLNDTEICHLHPKHIPYEPPPSPAPHLQMINYPLERNCKWNVSLPFYLLYPKETKFELQVYVCQRKKKSKGQ